MAIYAKKINAAQRRALEEFEAISGWEPRHQDDLDSGELTFSELWHKNQRALERMMADVTSINVKGCGVE